MKKTLDILSLGAGLQSSAMICMTLEGDLPMVDYAIFADTGWERQATYDHVEYLRSIAPFEIFTVTAGNIHSDTIEYLKGERKRVANIPYHIKTPPEQNGDGMLWRSCTIDYKVRPMRRKYRELMKKTGAKHIVQWMGITIDEVSRMKDSDRKYITNYYPLIDANITRYDCHKYLVEHNYKIPPKSACI